jgi:hypothetical protein
MRVSPGMTLIGVSIGTLEYLTFRHLWRDVQFPYFGQDGSLQFDMRLGEDSVKISRISGSLITDWKSYRIEILPRDKRKVNTVCDTVTRPKDRTVVPIPFHTFWREYAQILFVRVDEPEDNGGIF